MNIFSTKDSNNFFSGNFTEDKIPNGLTIVNVFYNGNFVKPKFINNSWIEGATQIEINNAIKPFVPEKITNAQLRLALIDFGISISSINSGINLINDLILKEKATALFEYANYFYRNDPLLNQLAMLLGLNDEQIDLIFINGNLL